MVGCYDVKNATLDVLSIYRDTLVDVPWRSRKSNSVYNNQGMEGVQQQVKNLIGYVPDYYFVVGGCCGGTGRRHRRRGL